MIQVFSDKRKKYKFLGKQDSDHKFIIIIIIVKQSTVNLLERPICVFVSLYLNDGVAFLISHQYQYQFFSHHQNSIFPFDHLQ